MPDKPTDKKLSFVEYSAKRRGMSPEFMKEAIKIYVTEMISLDLRHNKDCPSVFNLCTLCALETMFSEYRKYFKQK